MTLSQGFLLVIGSAIVSSVIMFASAWTLKRRVEEYRDARTVVKAVITTYNGRLAHQEEGRKTMSMELDRLRVLYEKLQERQDGFEEMWKKAGIVTSDLGQALRDASMSMRSLTESLRAIQESSSTVGLAKGPTTTLETSLDRSHEVTSTEIRALQILATEGPKTSPQLYERVGRSREHFARLMKRLYERGYVDRDRSKLPFLYKINGNVLDKVLRDPNPPHSFH